MTTLATTPVLTYDAARIQRLELELLEAHATIRRLEKALFEASS